MIQGLRSMPVLSATDVDEAIAFYTNGLGFSLAGAWRDENEVADFAIIQMDQITIGLMRAKTVGANGNWAGYFYVSDVDALADFAQANGVALAREVADQHYGCRDFDVKDPSGNVVCFGQDLSPTEEGPGL